MSTDRNSMKTSLPTVRVRSETLNLKKRKRGQRRPKAQICWKLFSAMSAIFVRSLRAAGPRSLALCIFTVMSSVSRHTPSESSRCLLSQTLRII